MYEVLRNRPFVLLWLAQIFTQLGANTLTFVLTLRIFELTNSNTAVGFLLMMFGLPTFFFGLSAGVLTDRFNKLRILFLVNLALSVLVVLFYPSSQSLTALYLLVFLFSLVLQLFFPSTASLIPHFVPEKVLLSANSLFTLTLYTTVILGYVSAGPLLSGFGRHQIFLFLSSYFLFSAWLIRRIGLAGQSSLRDIWPRLKILWPGHDQSLYLEIRDSFRQTLELINYNQKIRHSLSLLVFSQLLVTTLLSLSPGFAVNVLRIELAQSSVFVVLPAALGMLAGSVWLGFFGRRFPWERLSRPALLAIVVSLLMLSLSNRMPLAPLFFSFITILVFGLSNACLEIPSNTLIQEESKHFRGRIYGLLGTLVYGISLLPLLVVGYIADQFGTTYVLLVLSLLAFGFFVRMR